MSRRGESGSARRLLLSVLLGATALACGEAPEPTLAPEVEGPHADLSGVEPRVAELLSRLAGAVDEQPDSAEAWGGLGAGYDAHGMRPEAERSYRRAAALDPADFRWAYFLTLIRQGRGAAADEIIERFEVAERLNPSYAPLAFRLGQSLSLRGDAVGAEAAYRRALDLDPAFAMARRNLGQLLLARGEAADAARHLEQAARLAAGRDGSTYASLAQAYMLQGDEERGRLAAEQASGLPHGFEPDDPLLEAEVRTLGTAARHWLQRAKARAASNDYDGAIVALEVVLETRAGDAEVHYLMGAAAARVEQPARGLASLERALSLDPDHAGAHVELGKQLERTGRHDEALVHYIRASELDPGDAAALALLAQSHAMRGEVDQVIAVFEALAELRPGDARIQVNLGTAVGRQGELQAAAAYFRRALEIDPDYADAHHRLGVALENLGRRPEAFEHYRAAVRIDPGHPAALRLGDDGRELPAAGSRREEFERIAARLYAGDNTYLGRARISNVERQLETEVDPAAEVDLRSRLARYLLEAGEVDRAIAEIERAIRRGGGAAGGGVPVALIRLRGIAYLRQAEVRNCVLRHNPDCCIFPLERGGLHTERGPAVEARRSYEALLSRDPTDLEALWLLNIAAMALGDWPTRIAADRQLHPAGFDSTYDIGRFRDVAPQLGLDRFNLCGGALVEDFDGDGRLDILTSSYDPLEPMAYFRNRGDGRFEDRSEASGAANQLGGFNTVAGDYDNDGDVDVFVLRGAWLMDDGRIPNTLLRNDGRGRFTDVTRRAGLDRPAYPTQVAAWGDYDNDGDLDLYIGNESRKYLVSDRADYPSQLFLNNGDGSFTDGAPAAGVTNDRYTKGVAAGDYDNDGDLDLYLSNAGENRLYRNDGRGSFTDVAREAGVSEPRGRSFATWFFDYDNDGWLDLFVAAFEATVADLAAENLGLPHRGQSPRLYRNRGDGSFDDVTRAAGLDHVYLPMGANFGDLDNDGWLDIYLATGDPHYRTLMPNVMLRNDRGRRFQNVTSSGGFGHLQKGHGVAFADLDNDGDQDIYHQLGGFYPGDKFRNALFENPGHGGAWLFVTLNGVRSNRAGHGARIVVVVDGPEGERSIHRAAGSVSSFGASPARQEIGLGQATAILRLEVYWPASGVRQIFPGVPLDTAVRVIEGRETTETLPMRHAPFASRR